MRVGTRKLLATSTIIPRDHPHACGDKKNQYYDTQKKVGSSPCVWGQVRSIRYLPDSVGIIPMRVGTRSANEYMETVTRDHPHACGDKAGREREWIVI